MSENICVCGADKDECDVLIDIFTPFLQVIGGRKYRLLFETVARQVLLSDGSNVETRLKTLERALSAFSITRFAEDIYMRNTFNSQMTEGDRCYVFDATDDENVEKGGAMYLWHDGGWQLLYDGDIPLDVNSIIKDGAGLKIVDGRLVVDLAGLLAAGDYLKVTDGKLAFDPSALVAADAFLELVSGKLALDLESLLAALAGSGISLDDDKLNVNLTSDLTSGAADMALSALGGKTLNEAIAALAEAGEETARKLAALEKLAAANFAPNDEIVIEESGDWEVPEDGVYEVTCIGGGNGGSIHANGLSFGGNAAAPNTKVFYLKKGRVIPVTVGAGGKGVLSNQSQDLLFGGRTSFLDLTSVTNAPTIIPAAGHDLWSGYQNDISQSSGVGAGRGGASTTGNPHACDYGGGGGAFWVKSSMAIVGNGGDGVVIIRFYNPEKEFDAGDGEEE